MGTKRPENCWEYWNCPETIKKDCLAFKSDSGKDCWNVTKDFRPFCRTEFEHCGDCPWYKINNPDL
jgi:hypothetical protein